MVMNGSVFQPYLRDRYVAESVGDTGPAQPPAQCGDAVGEQGSRTGCQAERIVPVNGIRRVAVLVASAHGADWIGRDITADLRVVVAKPVVVEARFFVR